MHCPRQAIFVAITSSRGVPGPRGISVSLPAATDRQLIHAIVSSEQQLPTIQARSGLPYIMTVYISLTLQVSKRMKL
jgi:hypothetical protein